MELKYVRRVFIIGLIIACQPLRAQEENAIQEPLSYLPMTECPASLYGAAINTYSDTVQLNLFQEDTLQICCPERMSEAMAARVEMMSTPGSTPQNYIVGQIPYSHTVTPSGWNVYIVPIEVSAFSKMPPQISLVYNSQGGDGIAGYGWDIGGLSQITLTAKNIYYHGKTDAPSIYDTDGVYSLDGTPLVQNDNAAMSSDYPLQTARGNIMVKRNVSNGNTTYFEALFPDGSKAVYGETTNTESRSVYRITLKEDRLGNTIVYNYTGPSASARLISIQYGHRAISDYIGQISFIYEQRGDYHDIFYANESITQEAILKQITTESAGKVLFNYYLGHEQKALSTMLTQIRKVASDGSEVHPLTFSYAHDTEAIPSSHHFNNPDPWILHRYFSSANGDTIDYLRGHFVSQYVDGFITLPRYSTYVVNRSSGIYSHHYGSILR